MNMQDLRTRNITVYHITHDKNLPMIMSQGIKPMLGRNSAEIGETNNAVHVFLTWDALEDAVMNWDSMSWSDEVDPELSVITLNIPSSIIHMSTKLSDTGEIYQTIPPDMITSVAELY
jgi:hypothetical protein